MNKDILNIVNRVLSEEYNDKMNESKKDMCEQCGGTMKEGECSECGYMKEEFKEGKKLSKKQEYIAKQAEPKNKIDAKDFAKLRSKKSDTKNSKSEKTKVDESRYSIELDGKRYVFNENEVVNIIENIVLEEKSKEKKMTKTLNVTKDSQNKSKKENDDYISSVVKKMKDYLKDGSKGDFEMEPDSFPKGNGELAKMDKMAYVPSDGVEEYVQNFTAAGLENLDYDTIHPNEEWVDDLMVGSSRTGNNPEWANAVETPVNKKRNQIRKDNLLAKIKRKAYNKSAQPIVNDKSGNETDKASKIMMQVESETEKKVLSDIEKMKKLLSYNSKTQ